ncbi:MAG: hypothetical protein WCJ49_06110 [Deltaproteobacteria bacterium]
MRRIVVDTKKDSFLILQSITNLTPTNIVGKCTLKDMSYFLALESCAQLGAFHIRYLEQFNRHAFLLKIKSFSVVMPQAVNQELVIVGDMTARSNDVFSYTITIKCESISTIATGFFLFAVKEYDNELEKVNFRKYYEKAFSCLINA